jgi:hypothetical protein
MNTPSIIVTKNCITAIFDGHSPMSVTSDSPNYNICLENIKSKDWDLLLENLNVENSVKNYVSSSGHVKVQNGQVLYMDTLVDNVIVDRILDFMQEGLPFEPLVKFLENLMMNPSFRSRKELYNFLENENLPITEDGHFLAYKAVRGDYMDIYSGKFYNGVGTTVSMPRHDVDDDCNNGCSKGLHVGSLEYVRGYGCSNGRYLVVKVNPANVVSVPSEDARKLRTCSYTVLSEFKEELNKPCYNSCGEDICNDDLDNCDFDDDFGDVHNY